MNSTDQATFQNGLALAQAGQKEAAYAQFKILVQTYPNDITLLLWIVFTTPYMIEAEKNLERAAAIEPTNPSVSAAYTWLASERQRREAEERQQELAQVAAAQSALVYAPEPKPVWERDHQQSFQPDAPNAEWTTESTLPIAPDAPNTYDTQNPTMYPMPANVYPSIRPRTRNDVSGVVWLIMAVLVLAIAGVTVMLVINGNKTAKIPVEGPWASDLAPLEKMLRASDTYTSVRFSMTTDSYVDIAGKKVNEMAGVLVQPDHVSLHWSENGTGTDRIFIGNDLYENANGRGWRKGILVGASVQDVIASVDKGSLSFDKVKTWGGSTITFKSDEKVDGITVGVIEIDTSTCTTSAAADLKSNKATFKYDKKTNRLILEELTGGLFGLGHADIHYTNYDSPNNHVDPPETWQPI